MVLNMLKRKLRKVADSLVISIPKQVCDMNNFKDGNYFSIETIGINELRLKKEYD